MTKCYLSFTSLSKLCKSVVQKCWGWAKVLGKNHFVEPKQYVFSFFLRLILFAGPHNEWSCST